jgi:hypothetical protein
VDKPVQRFQGTTMSQYRVLLAAIQKSRATRYGSVHCAVHSDVKANFDKYFVELHPPSTTMV